MRVFLFSLLAMITISACAAPCTGVDRSLDQNRKKQLAPVIAKQLNITSADILQSFKYQSWYIIFAETHVSDETYLFFKGDPVNEKYLTLWSGAAKADEERQIQDWTVKHAEGIPPLLAGCFAWHVTKDRPSQHYVPDAEAAIKIAVASWVPIYGENQIAREKPYIAVLQNGIWTVQGSLSKELVGGVAIAEIAQIDGKVIRVSHGK